MNINAFVRDRELASRIAKRGTESDIALFNYKEGEKHLNVVSPIRYPDKLSSLIFSLHMADVAVLDISEMNREVGEIIVALSSLNMARGAVVLRNYLLPEQVEPFLKETPLKDYRFLEDSPEVVREFLFSCEGGSGDSNGPTRVVIDHHFPVKGVGLVALGIVVSGTVERHQKLRLFPTGKEAQVRSIQVHDVDVNSAGVGSRVGLALKNVKEDEMWRGMVLAEEGVDVFDDEVRIRLKASPFFGKGLASGDVVHLFAGLQMIPARIVAGEVAAGKDSLLTLMPEKHFADYPGMKRLLAHIDSPMPRIIGPFSAFNG